MKKLLVNALFGAASEIDVGELQEDLCDLLVDEEKIVAAYRVVRDLIIFTNRRMIKADKQGVTGTKIDYHSIPYHSVSHFAVETAGRFDIDSELKIWVSSSIEPLVVEFRKGTDVFAIQKHLAGFVLK